MIFKQTLGRMFILPGSCKGKDSNRGIEKIHIVIIYKR